MKYIFFAILFLISAKSFSQEECNVLLGKADFYPFKCSNIYGHFTCESVIADDKYKVLARSVNSNVSAVELGKIISIFNIDSIYKVIVIKSENYVYVYSSFDSIYVSKDEQIEKGKVLGKAKKTAEEKFYEIKIELLDSKANFLNEDKIWQIIKANNDSSAAVCDATALN